MPEVLLPKATIGGTTEQSIQNLYDVVIRLRKELEYLLANLDEKNVLKAKSVIADWIYVGTVEANKITTVNAKIGTAQIETLTVGGNVTMGANATIAWGKVTDTETITSTANNALTNAATAQSSATTANNLLADIASDSKLTPVEKIAVKKEWDGIVAEKTLNDTQADNFGVSKTTYGTTYTSLYDYITTLLSSLSTTSDITGPTFRSKFKDYYDARTNLLNSIATKAKTLAGTAQTDLEKIANGTYSGTFISNKVINSPSIVTNNSGITANDAAGLAYGANGYSAQTTDIRIWAGESYDNRATAPFRVTQAGAVTASNLTITGGSITWANVSPPSASQVGARANDWVPAYSDVSGTKPPTNADNTMGTIGTDRLTHIGSTGIYTGTLTADQINAVAINADSITTGTLTGRTIRTLDGNNKKNGFYFDGSTGVASLYAADVLTADICIEDSYAVIRPKTGKSLIIGSELAGNLGSIYYKSTHDFSAATIMGFTCKFA